MIKRPETPSQVLLREYISLPSYLVQQICGIKKKNFLQNMPIRRIFHTNQEEHQRENILCIKKTHR